MCKTNLIYLAVAIIAAITFVYLYKTLRPQKFVAQKALAAYLDQPQDTIACQLLKGGLSDDTVSLCTTTNNKYIVKSFKDKVFGRHEIAWTQHASDLGIGSHLYMADPQGSYYISAVAQGTTLNPGLASNPEIIKNIAHALSRLHNSKAPTEDVGQIDERIATKYQKLQSSGALQELLQKKHAIITQVLKEIATYSVSIAPCHNDLNPGNIFVADHHVTLIDWGDSALGNPYYDIAIFFVFNLLTQDKQLLFFKTYDAKLITKEWRHYFELLNKLVYFEFALNVLLGVQEQSPTLLKQSQLPTVQPVAHYLTLLTRGTDTRFLYEMALAALYKIK